MAEVKEYHKYEYICPGCGEKVMSAGDTAATLLECKACGSAVMRFSRSGPWVTNKKSPGKVEEADEILGVGRLYFLPAEEEKEGNG